MQGWSRVTYSCSTTSHVDNMNLISLDVAFFVDSNKQFQISQVMGVMINVEFIEKSSFFHSYKNKLYFRNFDLEISVENFVVYTLL